MQLRPALPRQRRMQLQPRLTRALVSLAFALAMALVPLAQAAACSCAMSTTEQAISVAELAFTGTVADQRDLGEQNDFGASMREYAFVVERANVATHPVTRVVAGTGGGSCGMTFANGEEWLILSYRGADGLETNLCSGNLRLTDVAPDEQAAIDDLLSMVPAEAPTEPAEGRPGPGAPPAPLLVEGAALALIGAVGFLAFRRGRPS